MVNQRELKRSQRIVGGDRAEGARLVNEEYLRVNRFLCHLTGSAEIAGDLTQLTFLKAWENLGGFRGESSLATWLKRIAYREYTYWLRSRRDHSPLDGLELVDPHIEGRLDAILLKDALAQLGPEQRETFLLYHVEGLSVAEVADVQEIPSGTVKSRLFHARKALRACLDEPKGAAHHETL